MNLQLIRGDNTKPTVLSPQVYKCKLVRNEGGFAEFMWYVGPYYLVPAGWHTVVRKPK